MPRPPAIPFVAHGEGAEGELGDEDRACSVETLDHGGIFIDGLVLESAGAPGGGIALYGEEVFRSPGQPVQGAAVVAVRNVGVGFARQVEGALLSERNAEEQHEVVALEAGQVHLGEVDGGNFAAMD